MWSKDEATFRNILYAMGESPTPHHDDKLVTIQASLNHPRYGSRELERLQRCLVTINDDGEDKKMLAPFTDPSFCRVLRKIVRGLLYHHTGGNEVVKTNRRLEIMSQTPELDAYPSDKLRLVY